MFGTSEQHSREERSVAWRAQQHAATRSKQYATEQPAWGEWRGEKRQAKRGAWGVDQVSAEKDASFNQDRVVVGATRHTRGGIFVAVVQGDHVCFASAVEDLLHVLLRCACASVALPAKGGLGCE